MNAEVRATPTSEGPGGAAPSVAAGRWRRAGLVAGWTAVVAPFLIEAVAIVRASQVWLVDRTPDDAFYYLEIARRIDHGQGLTFDGIDATNGFHPLWQALLAAVGLVVGGQTAFIKVDLLVCLALTLAAVLLLIRVVWRWLGPGAALMGAVVAVHGRAALPGLADGMEGALSVFTLAVLVTVLVWWFEAPSRRRAVAMGAISAAVVLARLDMVVVIWLVPVAMVWRARSWRMLPAYAAGAAVGIPWAAWYWIRYHHLLTTSATIKQLEMTTLAHHDGGRLSVGYLRYVWANGADCVRSVLHLAWDSVWSPGSALGVLVGVSLIGLAGLGVVVLSRSWVGHAAPAWALGTSLVMLGAKAAFDLYTVPTWADSWYLTPQRVAVPFALGALAWLGGREMVRRWPPVGVVAVAVLCVVGLPLTLSNVTESPSTRVDAASWQGQIGLAADWVVAHGPPGRYGADDAGLLGYRLDGTHPVVDVDGLVDNYRYAALVARGSTLRQQLAATGVDVYVNRIHPSQLAALGCARVLWRSPNQVAVLEGGTTLDRAPVDVLDVRRCR